MTGTDIISAIDEIVAEHERCPCGRDLPADCPSFYWCSETCQTLWIQHQHDPTSPHPAAVREAREERAARAGLGPAPRPPAPGRAADGEERMRLWGSWDPLLDEQLDGELRYRRWCPSCEDRTVPDPRRAVRPRDIPALFRAADPPSTGELEPAQACSQCAHVWDGPPLSATIEVRTEPFHALRLALSDGRRSAFQLIQPQVMQRGPAPLVALHAWVQLETELLGAPTHAPARTPVRRSAWDWMSRGRIP